ncbi:MAG: glycosyltransferase [Flavobacteriia bacterium]|nr:glycosyltransferase [Flavobacteriia bacterium]
MDNLSIVILNWNGKHFLKEYLPKLIQYSSGVPIYVADNASNDGSVEFIKEYFTDVKCILLDKNYGFAQGYNEALKEINSRYYLLINSDIEVSPSWIDPLLKIMENNEIACCQPKILSISNKKRFEHAGASGGFLDRNFFPFCRGRILHITEEDNGQYDSKKEIFWASGACLMIQSELFHKVGGFDAHFFAHMEEIDLCWRLKLLGYKIYVEPTSVVYHVGGGTLKYMSPFKTYLNFRNSLFMITKNYSGNLFLKIFYRMILDGMASMLFLFQGNFSHFNSVLKAHFSFYKHLPYLLNQRKEIQKNIQQFNPTGLYKSSILWAFYFRKINSYMKLNKKYFQ